MYEVEQEFSCPYCGAWVSVLLDPSVSRQSYVEDCEVCCRPLMISYEADGEAVTWFEVEAVEQ